MLVTITKIGSREFLYLEDVASIPIDTIKKFDFNVPNGGATYHSVKIVTTDDEEDLIFTYQDYEDIKAFVLANKL